MSFTIKEFATVRLISTDLAKTRDWYRSFFGQEPVEDSAHFVSFKIAGVSFDITLPDSKNPFSAGGSIGYWLVDDLAAVLKKAEALGGKLYRGPLEVSETGRSIMQIQDPFGNVIGFEAPTPFI